MANNQAKTENGDEQRQGNDLLMVAADVFHRLEQTHFSFVTSNLLQLCFRCTEDIVFREMRRFWRAVEQSSLGKCWLTRVMRFLQINTRVCTPQFFGHAQEKIKNQMEIHFFYIPSVKTSIVIAYFFSLEIGGSILASTIICTNITMWENVNYH